MKKTFILTVTFLVLAVELCAQAPASKVAVALVAQGTLTQKQNFNGTLQFNQKSKIAAQSFGAVTKLYFDKGQMVKKGELLLEIDSEILDARISGLESEFKQAQLKLERSDLDFKRYQALYKNASIAKQKYDEFYYQKEELKQNVFILEAKLKAEKIARKKKHLLAAFDGMIVSRSVQEGEWVKEGDEVALLINPHKIDLIFHLPATYLNNIQNNHFLNVEINHKKYKAKVIGPLLSGDENTRTFPFVLQLNSQKGQFFEGMQASVTLGKSLGRNILLVPRDAIVRKYDKTVIYVVVEGKAKLLNVHLKGMQGTWAAVVSKGLKKGMQVVVKGNERLYPGARVLIK